MVDDNLVSSKRPKAGLHCRGDCSAGVNVSYDCSVFGVVAVEIIRIL